MDGYELLTVLERHYGSAGVADRNELVYPSSRDYSVKVRWKDGRVGRIESGPAFKADEVDLLRSVIREQLIDSLGRRVATSVLFSSPRRVSGYFRTNRLQIMPASVVAPRPPETSGQHPFYLQLALAQSVDGFLTNQRMSRLTFEGAWTLNAILRVRVKVHGPQLPHLWTLCNHESDQPPSQWHTHWTQEYYIDPGIPLGLLTEFPPADVAPIAQIPHDEYYGLASLPGGDELVLPDSLGRMLDTIEALEHADRRRFMRAARWLVAARDLWDHHVSSYYISLIAAIESLSSEDKPPRCSGCGQVRDIGRRFQEFVERYAPPTSAEVINRKRLYQLRSDLAHGKMLIDIDEAPYAIISLSPNWLEQREAFDALSSVVRRVVIGWLESRSAAEGNDAGGHHEV
jgi:hypothetical protein